MNKALSYDDVYLVPKYSILPSRKNANTSVELGKHKFRLPVIPANMESVIDPNLYYLLTNDSIFCIMHRFGSAQDMMFEPGNLDQYPYWSISVGVNERSIEIVKRAFRIGHKIDYITVDVAHGHHLLVKETIGRMKEFMPEAFIIAGNVTTAEAVEELQSWGADAIKVGVGPGQACTTRLQTGFHVPMFTAVQQCAAVAKVPIIADGGIRHYGDIAKALAAGATMVMCGSLFASCSNSPAIVVNGRKVYYGSSSFQAKREERYIEGTLLELDQSVTVKERIEQITQALQSSISYAGGEDLSCFSSVDYVVIK